MTLIDENSRNNKQGKESIWSKACLSMETYPKGKQNLRSILLMGSEEVGKTELLTKFYDRSETQGFSKTLALDYTFGRRAGRSLEKSICNIWELGGGATPALLELTNSILSINDLSVIIMLDLSLPNQLWNTLEPILQHIQSTIVPQEETRSTIDLNKFSLPIVILGGKYDKFQHFQPEDKKVICRFLRCIAHNLGATLQFYSSKDLMLVKRARDLISHHGFGHNITKSISQDYNKPLLIPAGSDSILESETTDLLGFGPDYFQSHFSQDKLVDVMPDDPAISNDFKESAIDSAIKFKRLNTYFVPRL